MQIYMDLTERIEEAYDAIMFVLLIESTLPSKQQKKLYNVTISTGPTGGEVL